MPEFYFFKKGNSVKALPKADTEKAAGLIQQGYQKLFEEINAADAAAALARLADIKKEEALTRHAFFTGPVFASVIAVVLFVFVWWMGG